MIAPILPELQRPAVMSGPFLDAEYSSEHDLLSPAEVLTLLRDHGLAPRVAVASGGAAL